MRYLSLFSGMEAAHLAWSPLGWQCVGVAEIDPNACALLRHRLPHVPNLGSVTDVTSTAIQKLGRIDVVIGGSPCQDLSVAGKRAGLAGARSSLFHEQLRIFDAARTLCGARWLVWENVPGAFSSNAGRDFAVVVGAMAGCDVGVPDDGWRNEGAALGEHGLVEWSVLDAQWFGVAQRRRRVFAVLDSGNWADRPPVLLEPESLRGDSAPRRETGEGAAVGAGRGVARRRGLAADATGRVIWPAEVAGTLDAHFGDKLGLEDQHIRGGHRCSSLPDAAACLTTGTGQRYDAETETLIPTIGGDFDVAHTLRADGFDASEDGTGRGTPLVPVAFVQNQRDEVRTMEVAGALAAEPGAKQQTYLATFCADDFKTGSFEAAEVARPLTCSPDRSRNAPIAASPMAVRRLTPRECERLQGAEDDWTLVPTGRRGMMADGPRYKMLGNSFAVPVIRWIGQQIERASRASEAA
jgi:DNA (cytosine-5)-methyltransferase 1